MMTCLLLIGSLIEALSKYLSCMRSVGAMNRGACKAEQSNEPEQQVFSAYLCVA